MFTVKLKEETTETATPTSFKNNEGDDSSILHCAHSGCTSNFRSNGRKLIHHNQHEPECKAERINIIKLVGEYKRLLLKVIKKQGKHINTNPYNLLEKQYEDLASSLNEDDYFSKVCGGKFYDAL